MEILPPPSRHPVAGMLRVALGLIFFVFGLNGFFGFIPVPPMAEPGAAFIGALMSTGYFFPVLKSLEILAGFLLLVNRFVPLALLILAPIAVQIFLFHAFLDPGSAAIGAIVLGLECVLLIVYRGCYAALTIPVFRRIED